MGKLWEDLIKINLATASAKEVVQEFSKDRTCDNCGRHFDRATGGRCMKSGFGCSKQNLCPNCIKVCRWCGKVFCEKHIKEHKCKK